MYKAKALTKNNRLGKMNKKQGRRCRCGSIKHLQITSNYFPLGISLKWTIIVLSNGAISSAVYSCMNILTKVYFIHPVEFVPGLREKTGGLTE